jgi:hypothetical protein
MQEKIRTATTQLRRDLNDSGRFTRAFIRVTLLSGAADPEKVADLRGRYEKILVEAAELDAHLSEIKPQNRKVQKVLGQTREYLLEIQLAAKAMLRFWTCFMTTTTKTPTRRDNRFVPASCHCPACPRGGMIEGDQRRRPEILIDVRRSHLE